MAQDTKIYLKLNKRPKNVAELIDKLWSEPYDKSVETYHNKECTIKQCASYKNRSFDDFYYLCKTYFPNVTPKKVFHELIISNRNNKIIACSHCETIRKTTIFFYDYKQLVYAWVNIYIYNIKMNKYNSKYSWEELYHLLNIHSNEDLIAYREKYNIKL